MKIKTVQFILSAARIDQCPPEGPPEFAFVGRSNVGKSSLLNCLLGRKGVAKTSSTPGKTQTLNFFNINDKIRFVDLPGYGFAKVPLHVKNAWQRTLTQFLETRKTLRLVTVLVDARHKPSPQDAQMLELLDHAEVPTLIVATKIDKVGRSKRSANIKLIRQTLALPNDVLITPFSAVTGEGKHEIWAVIDELTEGG